MYAKHMKRGLAFLLAVVMMFSVIPVQVYAAESTHDHSHVTGVLEKSNESDLLVQMRSLIADNIEKYGLNTDMSDKQLLNHFLGFDGEMVQEVLEAYEYGYALAQGLSVEETEVLLAEENTQLVQRFYGLLQHLYSPMLMANLGEENVPTAGVTVTVTGDGTGSYNEETGEVTVTATGYSTTGCNAADYQGTAKITVTNTAAKTIELSFNWQKGEGVGDLTISGDEQPEGSVVQVLAAGESIVLNVTTTGKGSSATAVFTMSDFVSKGTIEFGSATNGSYIVGTEDATAGLQKTDILNTTYILTATPAEGYAFMGWCLDGAEEPASFENPYTYTNKGYATITPKFAIAGIVANFAEAKGENGASGSYTVNGETAPKEFTGGAGAKYTLVATPADEKTMELDFWYNETTGEQLYEKEEEVIVTINEDTIFYPVFRMLDVYTITTDVNDAEMGTVSPTREVYEYDKTTVEATPNKGALFVHWEDSEGTILSTDSKYEFDPDKDMSLKAVFRWLEIYTITVQANDSTMGTVTETHEVYEFDSTTVEATVNQGYFFDGWFKEDGETQLTAEKTYKFAPTENTTLIAKFRTANPYSVNVTWDETLGTVTMENVVEGNIAYEGTTVKLTAVPAAGSTFLGWVDATNKIYKTNASVDFTNQDISYRAVFAKEGGTPWFGVGTGSNSVTPTHLFDDWDTAMSAGPNVVLMNNAILPARAIAYEIPSGKTLIIPYNTSNSYAKEKPTTVESDNYVTPYVYRTLTMEAGAHINVSGALNVSAVQCAGGTGTGAGVVHGPYGHISMASDSSITVLASANLYVWGYISGSGSVVIKNKGTVYEAFQVMDWRGGSCTSAMANKGAGSNAFPFSQYYVQNVEVPMTLEAGASEWGYMSTTITLLGAQGAQVPFIGPDGMFNITSGYIVKDYDEAADRLVIDSYGAIEMKRLQISMKLAMLGSTTIDTANFDLPINSNISVRIHNVPNSTTTNSITITQNVIFLPGSEIVIEEGAECILGTNNNIYLFDQDNWDTYVSHVNVKLMPVRYAHGRIAGATNTKFRNEKSLVDAKLVINGIVNASAGGFYTTLGGANISSTGSGKIIMNQTAGTNYFIQATQSGTDAVYKEVSVTSAKLRNANGNYVSTTLEEGGPTKATYEYVDGEWINVCNDGEHTFTIATDVKAADATCMEAQQNYAKCAVCIVVSDTATVSVGTPAEHSMLEPTCEAPYTCKYNCGFTTGEPLGHEFTDKCSNVKAVDATCETPQQNYVQCNRCEVTTEGITNAKVDFGVKLGHTFNTKPYLEIKVSPATCLASALYYVQCDRCEAYTEEKTVEDGEKAACAYRNDDELYGEIKTSASCVTNEIRWDKCVVCGQQSDTATQIMEGTKLDHTYELNNDSGEMAQEATCYTLQKNYVKCDNTNCVAVNYAKTVEVADTLKGHNFGETKSDMEATPADCVNPATYYVKCDNTGCTAVSETKTVSFGNPNTHVYTEMIPSNVEDEAATCTTQATYYVKCNNCDNVHETLTVKSGNSLGHLFEEGGDASGVTASEKTCTTKETRYVLCGRENCFANSSVMTDEGKAPIVVEIGDTPVGHKFTLKGDVVSENDCKTNTLATWKGKCYVCGEQSENEEDYIIAETVEHDSAAEEIVDLLETCNYPNGFQLICTDCETVFETYYLAEGDDGYVAKLGHDYSAEFVWAGYTAASVTLTCGRCDEDTEGYIQTMDCEVSSVTTPATCAAEGKTVYTAKVAVDGKVYSEEKIDPIEQLEHTYATPVFTWETDYSSAIATVTCTRESCTAEMEGHSQTLECTVSYVTTPATCAAEGKTVYTAETVWGGETYTDTKEENLEKLDHIYGEPTFQWSDDNTCTATYGCTECDEVVENVACSITTDTVDATCLDPGIVTFTASIQVGDETYYAEKTETGVPAGHDYAATFAWVDYSADKVSLSCQRTGCDNLQILDCLVTSETLEATCAAAGKTVYTATVTYEGKEYTDTKEDPIEQLAHIYGTPEYNWATDYSSATATFTCTRINCTDEMLGHSETLECNVSFETTEATCAAAGNTTYTAEITIAGNDYTDIKEEAIEQLSHIYGDPVFNWATDYSSATVTFTCTRENCTEAMAGHSVTLNGNVSSKTVNGADCQTHGTITYKAVVEWNGQEYEDTKTTQGPVGNHERVRTVVAPTCEDKGYTHFTCKLCDGLDQKMQYVDALGHDMADATCTAPSTCRREDCNHTEGEKLPHSFTNKDSGNIASVANCNDPEMHYVQCDNCTEISDSITVAHGSAKGHSYTTKPSGQQVSEATCTEAAKYYVQCDNCDEVTTAKSVSVGEANGHAFNEKASSQLVSVATCTEAAKYYVQCDNCTAVTTDKIVSSGKENGHSYTTKKAEQLASEATCTEAAKYYVQCDNCTEVSADKTVAFGKENGHSFTTKASQNIAVEASCTEAAKYYVQCDNCNEVTNDKTVAFGETLPHSFESTASTTKATDADCENAATYFVRCENCTAVSDKLTVPVGKANGHKFNEKVSEELASEVSCTAAARYYIQCDNCDEITKEKTIAVGEAKGHSFTTKDSGVVKNPATCNSKAVHKVLCDNCTMISDEVTIEVGEPLKHEMAAATCELPATCKNGCGLTEGEALGHVLGEATCKNPPTCQRENCKYTEGDKLPHTPVDSEELPARCEEPGHKAGVQCAVCGTTLSGMQVIPATGHILLEVPAKKPTFGNIGWEAYERCANCNYTTMVEIPALPIPSVTTYDEFIESLIVLEELTAEYIQQNPAKDPLGLMIEYIRTGVDRYNSGSWNIMAGYEDPDYAKFISQREDEINSQMDNVEDMIKVTALKDIHEFYLPNGDGVDFGHMFGTMDITYHNNFSINHADVAGWAGDLVDLLSTADRHNVYAADENGNYPTIEEMAKTIAETYLMHDIAGEDDQFGHSDMYGDLDGYYLMKIFQNQGYETGDMARIMQAYFTEGLTDEYRAEYFLKNRLAGVSTRNAVRDAVYSEYVSNKVISTLEGTRDFKTADISQLRIACCYAFADYLCRLGGDFVEVPDNKYYTVFESEFSNLAPGITQEIKKATTADNKQIVYYIATADLNREDVNVYANYNENDPTLGWKMSRVLDQAQAAQDKYGDPASDKYIENYNVITSINADGFNMTTGEPGGVLVMGGVEYHPVNSNGFFGILKNGKAVIGTTAEYREMKDQVQEAVAGFGTMLVDEGEIVISRTDNYYSDRASRTAVGITRSGKVIFMVLDGRQEPVSCGGSMQEIAQIMLEAGCYYAINLDGGGSTTYVAKPEGEDSLRVVSKPSDGFARSVSTSLMMVSTAPSSTAFDHAAIESDYDYLTPGSSIQVSAKGISATGNEAEIPEGAYLAVDNAEIASVTEDGVLTGLSLGDVQVSLMLGDTVLGSKKISVVNPDAVYFTREALNVVFGSPTELPVKAQYRGKAIAINTSDVKFSLSNALAGTFDGFAFIANGESGLKVVTVTAALTADSTKTGSINVSMFNQGEMSFDFEMATAGDRQLAWDRQVTNATTGDNSVYEVVNVGEPMVTNYTFALDISEITMPEVLEDLTYMLPGADAADASAWKFLLQLAERVSVLTEVSAKMYFDKNFDVDYSALKIVCEYFVMNNPETDLVFNAEENSLTMTLHWKDQTQAIDPETADPLCLLSGIKLIPKADAAWDAKDRLIPVHTGEISYNIFLRANALYTFACKEANQKEYGLLPFENPDVIIGGATEKGGSFKDTYKTFSDTYTLINAVRNGWVGAEGGYMYYVNGEYYTGIQEVDGYYYDFGQNGICIGQQKYNGLFQKDGKTMYARFGVLVKNDWMSVKDERYCFDENGYGYHGTFVIDEVELTFENGKLVGGYTGFVEKTDGKTYHYINGTLTLGWYLEDGDWYHFDTGTGAMNTGTHVLPDAEAKSKNAYYDFGPDGKLLCGYFNPAGYYYWPGLIEGSEYAGTGLPKIEQWVQSGSVADDWPANGATKDAWYRTNSHGHFVTGGNNPNVFKYEVDGVTHNAIKIAFNNREYTFDNDYGYLLRGFFSYTTEGARYYWVDEAVNNGWFQVDGKTYYAFADGYLAIGTHMIDGQSYMFNNRGELIEEGLRLFATISADGSEMTISTSETKDLKRVRVAVWSDIDSQDDLVWVEAKVNAKGEWIAEVALCQFKDAGKFQIHVYATDANGVEDFLIGTTTPVAKLSEHKAGEPVQENIQDATCTVDGSYDMVTYCSGCGVEMSRTSGTIEAGHQPAKAVIENMTDVVCVTGGSYDLVVYCSLCNAELSREHKEVPGGAHQANGEVIENNVAATCTEDGGYDIVTKCEVCDAELSREHITVEATGHAYTDEQDVSCNNCGEIRVIEPDDCKHAWDEGEVTTKPGCTTKGEKTYTCTKCEKEKTEAIPATGHNYVNSYCEGCGALKFTDVVKDSFYYDAVVWAVRNNITNGYGSDEIFNPDGTCTRGQIVTFLWRANGSPEPASLNNPFVDVAEDAYYYKAVLWAVENGITAGYGSDTIFNPDGACTRGQVATFLWRANGKPSMSGAENPFTDVDSNEFYYEAVLWAVANGITNGYGSDTTFAPNLACSRSQIVTFLYRDMQ